MKLVVEALRKLAETFGAEVLSVEPAWWSESYFCHAKGGHDKFWARVFDRYPHAAQLQFVFRCVVPRKKDTLDMGPYCPEFRHPADLLGFLVALVEGEDKGRAVAKLLRLVPPSELVKVRYP